MCVCVCVRRSADLLDHLWVLLHDVQEAVVRRHGSWALLGRARQLLEQICDDVVQTGAAASAHHRIWKEQNQTHNKYTLNTHNKYTLNTHNK